MRELRVSTPELALIAGTRGALGIGIGMLLSGRLGAAQRKAIGLTLLVIGALSTIPLALEIFGRPRGTTTTREGIPAEGRGPRSDVLAPV